MQFASHINSIGGEYYELAISLTLGQKKGKRESPLRPNSVFDVCQENTKIRRRTAKSKPLTKKGSHEEHKGHKGLERP